jgi:hypothetical protein
VSLFFGTILIAKATGNYQIIPEAVKKGEIISISEVKGYYTIEETAAVTGLSLEEVYKKLEIPQSVSKETKLKEISNLVSGYDFDAAKSKAGGTEGEIPKTDETENTNEANKVDISGIKGSMTINEASETLKMEIKEFYKLFKIPEDVPAQTLMKEISTIKPEYDFEKVKESLR